MNIICTHFKTSFLNIYLFIYLIVTGGKGSFFFFGCVWSSLLCAGFPTCGEWRLLFVAVRGLLTAVASPYGARALGAWL